MQFFFIYMAHLSYYLLIIYIGINFVEHIMFLNINRLDQSLKASIASNSYKTYRVIIQCSAMTEHIEKKIKSYRGIVLYCLSYINCIAAIISPAAVKRLLEFPNVKHIFLDEYAFLCGNSVSSSNRVNFQTANKLTGKGVTIGLIDTGTYPHADLVYSKNKIIKFMDNINNLKYPYDDNGHGTFISGIIAGSGKLSNGMYKGIAVNSNIYSIKAFNSIGKGFISDILYSMECLLNDSSSYNIKIITLPFELVSHNINIVSLFNKYFQIAKNNNIVVVVPAGHNGNTQCSIQGIAALDNCITVGGLDTTSDKICAYKYSSCGPLGKLNKPNLAAACVNICSLNTNINFVSERNGLKLYPPALSSNYTTYSGTSCAAAYISGICALLFERKPELTFNDILSILAVSCNLIDIPKWLQGSGIVDVNRLFS